MSKVAKEIVEGLTEFADSLENNDVIGKEFAVSRMQWDHQPVRLYVKRKSVKSISQWLNDRYIKFELKATSLSLYSHYFVIDRSTANAITNQFKQRDLRITAY